VWRGKRILDVAIVSATALVWIPVATIVALAVRLLDGPPVLFIQERQGLNGAPFQLVKFRTMRLDPTRQVSRVEPQDPSVTPLGRFLRRSKLDELPQLVHVLAGRMSLVGPRPLPRSAAVMLLPGASRRLKVRPGLTGLAQVSGGVDLPPTKRLELDLQYIREASPWMDLVIILRTLGCRPRCASRY
jgi:lipopolysaccharide/colanic/teichoic acid biosynthesis glycosyltransferase